MKELTNIDWTPPCRFSKTSSERSCPVVQSVRELEKSLLRFLYLNTRLVFVKILNPGMCDGSILVLAYCNNPSAVVFFQKLVRITSLWAGMAYARFVHEDQTPIARVQLYGQHELRQSSLLFTAVHLTRCCVRD